MKMIKISLLVLLTVFIALPAVSLDLDSLKKDGYTLTKLDLNTTRNLNFHDLGASGAIRSWGGSEVRQVVTTPARVQGEKSLKIQTGNNLWNSCFFHIYGMDTPIPAGSPHIGKMFVVSAWVYLENAIDDPAEGPYLSMTYIQNPETRVRTFLPEKAPVNRWIQIVTPIYTVAEGHGRFNIVVNGGYVMRTTLYFANFEVYQLTR